MFITVSQLANHVNNCQHFRPDELQREKQEMQEKAYFVQLQGIGKRKAIPAYKLVPGSVILYNFGYKGLVLAVQPSATGKTYTITTKDEKGRIYSRKTTKDRLFAIE